MRRMFLNTQKKITQRVSARGLHCAYQPVWLLPLYYSGSLLSKPRHSSLDHACQWAGICPCRFLNLVPLATSCKRKPLSTCTVILPLSQVADADWLIIKWMILLVNIIDGFKLPTRLLRGWDSLKMTPSGWVFGCCFILSSHFGREDDAWAVTKCRQERSASPNLRNRSQLLIHLVRMRSKPIKPLHSWEKLV